MEFPRRSGILLHPTSLPSRFGIGDLGQTAFNFVDFLAEAGQSYWQVLPLSPTGYDCSPYQGLSAFAGNPMWISPMRLVEAGHLSEADLANPPSFPEELAGFARLIPWKNDLLHRAFTNFKTNAPSEQIEAFAQFCHRHTSWLDDFALFLALKEDRGLQPWFTWEPELRTRHPEALEGWRARLHDAVDSHRYRQWQCCTQWAQLKSYAHSRGVRIIGDIPIFVSLDSADVWANPHLFQFDDNLQPTAVSGVPPDYFSKTGQLWGHPLYRWDTMARNGYAWWISRFRMALTQADVLRVDHFRGFHNYWAVPAGEKTAMHGHWQQGPGAEFFRSVTAALGDLTIIAEDLGDFNSESRAAVDAIQNEFGYPGIKVLQFAFNGGPRNLFLPHTFSHDTVVYTGTHDNNTCLGWYQGSATKVERDCARRYLGTDGSDIAWDLIRLAWGSVAHTAITTAQDLLSLGEKARMNTPATVGTPNWGWRMRPRVLDERIAQRLLDLTAIYGRRR